MLHDPPGAPVEGNDIVIHGARHHNLKNITLRLPRDRFVVITGVSGSGKSTLAFDLLFAEGQRRFLDAMSTYARQFVDQMARPEVDLITGLPPTVSIEQRNSRGGGKSTVATVTEVYHFFRLLFARLGTQHCPDCRQPVQAQTRDALGKQLQAELKQRGDLRLLAPVVRNRKGFHSDVAAWAAKHGYAELRADGKMYRTDEPFRLDRFREHDVELVVGLLERDVAQASRLHRAKGRNPPQSPAQLIDAALKLGQGTVFALDHRKHLSTHSTERACPGCGRAFAPLDPKNFSYNSAQGWCPKCRGFGELFYLPDAERGADADSVEETWWRWNEGQREICPECHGDRLRPESRAVRLDFVPANVRRLTSNPKSEIRNPKSGGGPTIDDLSALSVESAFGFFTRLKLDGRAAEIARDILPEIVERLKFLNRVGLGYLQLGRGVPTLSGGEAQRIRLAAQLGSNLSGVLYVLDEPTIGLHARDNDRLLDALALLRSRGNSVVVVEHDEETMRRADYVLDLGPGAGVHGGEVVAAGTLAELQRHPESITGQCLREQKTKQYPARGQRRLVLECGDLAPLASSADPSADAAVRNARGKAQTTAKSHEPLQRGSALPTSRQSRESDDKSPHSKAARFLTLRRASANNLKNLDVSFPLGRLVLVTGVSGSGKSTLVRECLLPALQSALATAKRSTVSPSLRSSGSPTLSGHETISSVHEVDQTPIGRTPRSTPATYVGFFDDIRALFAQLPEARLRGYAAGRFSFNSPQGRCPGCEGAGEVKLEMNFLPSAFVRCEQCGGTRFTRETLDIEFGGRNIAQVLELSVEEAIGVFGAFQKIKRPLEALADTGLGYIKLGQTSPTLSGGEAQRIKLVTHLLAGLKPAPDRLGDSRLKVSSSKLFVLEEPTIGLHMADVRRLVEVLQRLVDAGHSVIVIEHNLDLIAEADWVIDLGPEGGEAGGRVVCEGTPEAVARDPRSHTGAFLRKLLTTR